MTDRPLPWPGRKTVFAALFLLDGGTLVTISSNRVEGWDLGGGGLRWTTKLSQAFCLVEGAGTKSVVVSSTKGSVICVHVQTGNVLWEQATGIRDIRVMALQDGRIVGMGHGGAIRIWAGKTGKLLASYDTCLPLLRPQKVPGTDGPLVVTPMDDQILCRFDPDRGRLFAMGRFAEDDPVSVCPDGTRVLCLDRPNGALTLRTAKGKRLAGPAPLGMDRLGSWPPVWSPDGRQAVFCGSGEQGHILVDTADLSVRANWPGQGALPPAVHPDGTSLLLCGAGPARIVPIPAT